MLSDKIFDGEPPTSMLVNIITKLASIEAINVSDDEVDDRWPKVVEYFPGGYTICAQALFNTRRRPEDLDPRFFIQLTIHHKCSLKFCWALCYDEEIDESLIELAEYDDSGKKYTEKDIPKHLIGQMRSVMMRFCLLCQSCIDCFTEKNHGNQ